MFRPCAGTGHNHHWSSLLLWCVAGFFLIGFGSCSSESTRSPLNDSVSTSEEIAEEITGQDGASMRLVAGGHFLYGESNETVYLPAFYIDQYEVTARLYASFMATSGHVPPQDWPKQMTFGSGDRPVVQVNWHDAEAYCRFYGKALPTEQEWEKAARGTDGRLYPWGNDPPTHLHAQFDRLWWGYGTLATVHSHPAGRSPYGLFHMAGNVWEWTRSDFDTRFKVLRGGSWGHARSGLRTTHRFHRPPSYQNYFIGFRCAATVQSRTP
jgi:formylglycine-generating enzyme required for sulfatase activity